ncbi:MAG: glycosyltransferase family 2 protein [Bacteroidales bacterium]
MEKISATIITYNEERNIERCLKSLQGIADEIIIVDSYSNDGTKEICQKYNVHFFEHKFKDYSDQKNFANELTQNNLILSIDADEELSDTLRKSILEIKKNHKYDGYYFNRMTNYCGKWIKHSGWYPNHQLRLWDKLKGKWEGTIHEKLTIPKNNAIHIQGDLLHYSYESFSQHLLKIDQFTNFQALEMYKKHRKAGISAVIFKPAFRFLRHYFLRLGILDGYEGYIISKQSAYGQFLKYIKLKHLYKTNN